MTPGKSEADAKEFIVTLAFGSKEQAVSLLRQNPTLVNTLTMVDAIIPYKPSDLSKMESFNMPLQIRQLLGECAEQGLISSKKLWQTVNDCSPRNGETMATLLIKLMISCAQTIAQFAHQNHRTPGHMKELHCLRKILNSLIQDNSSMKIDVNVPNVQGQYPLQLLKMVAKNKSVFHLLSKEYEHIDALTNPTVKKRLQRNAFPKQRIQVIDVLGLPKITAKLTRNNGTDRCAISILDLQHPAFLKTVEKSPFALFPIYTKNTYLIASFSRHHVEIFPLREMYDASLTVHHNGKWMTLPYDSIYTTYRMLTKGKNDIRLGTGNSDRMTVKDNLNKIPFILRIQRDNQPKLA